MSITSNADLHKKLSDARSRLGRVLLECYEAHDEDVSGPDRKGCCCVACNIRGHVEATLEYLEA